MAAVRLKLPARAGAGVVTITNAAAAAITAAVSIVAKGIELVARCEGPLPLAIHEARIMSHAGRLVNLPWQAWAALAYMAIFSSALAYVLYFWMLRYLEASQLAAFTYLLPVLATILGILWLGEKGSWVQVLGGFLALGGVYWIESGRESIEKGNAVS